MKQSLQLIPDEHVTYTEKNFVLFFKYIVFYLFIWLCQVLAVVCRIFSCSMWTLSCCMSNLVTPLGIGPRAQSPNHWTTRDVPLCCLTLLPCGLFANLAYPGNIAYSTYCVPDARHQLKSHHYLSQITCKMEGGMHVNNISWLTIEWYGYIHNMDSGYIKLFMDRRQMLRIWVLFLISLYWLCHVACGILVSQPGIESRPLAGKAQNPNHWTTGMSQRIWIFKKWIGYLVRKEFPSRANSVSKGMELKLSTCLENCNYFKI